MAPRIFIVLDAAVLGLGLTSGCTAVLGMERASLEEDGGSAAGVGGASGGLGGASAGSSTTACTQPPTKGCSTCLWGSSEKGCDSAYDSCMADKTCRLSLDGYSACLGSRCGGAPEDCSRGLSASIRINCVADCATDCAKTALVSECELYCGCMGQYCGSHLSFLGDCMTACMAWPPEVATCRRDHCEWGKGATNHCNHASGEADVAGAVVCSSYAAVPTSQRHICASGKESTWACDVNAECCSKGCIDGVCK